MNIVQFNLDKAGLPVLSLFLNCNHAFFILSKYYKGILVRYRYVYRYQSHNKLIHIPIKGLNLKQIPIPIYYNKTDTDTNTNIGIGIGYITIAKYRSHLMQK